MGNFLQKYWWLVLGGVGAWLILRKKPEPEPIPKIHSGEVPRAGGGVDLQKISQNAVDKIRFYGAKEANAKGWSGNVAVQADANAVRVVFTHSTAGMEPEIAVMENGEMAVAAAQAQNLWG